MKHASKPQPETLIKAGVKRVLSMCGWFHFPVLQGIGAHKGVSDIIAIKNCIVLFIEIKTAKGSQSAHQVEFERNITEQGGRYVVIRSDVEMVDYLRSIGDGVALRMNDALIRRQP